MDDDGCTPPKTDLHKKRLSHNGFILAGKTPLYCAVHSFRRCRIKCEISMCSLCMTCFLVYFKKQQQLSDPPLILIKGLVIYMVSGSSWICCCHSCHVSASNCLLEESAQWGPSAKPGFRSVYPHWDSVSWDGTATECPEKTSPPEPATYCSEFPWDH